MSNSPLVTVTRISPNQSGTRTHAIDRITPHCVVGQCTAAALGEWFSKPSTQASSNYGIGRDGEIGMYVDEGNRSWCSSSNANDQRAVTIECASDNKAPYAFNYTVYNRLVELCADICRRNGKTKLLWIADKDTALAYEPAADEMVLTVHRWFANKSCPGDWMYARMGQLAESVTAALAPEPEPEPGDLFPDVPNDAWYHDDLKWAVEHEIVTGYPEGKFHPDDPLTRAQAVALLHRQAQLQNNN